MKNMIGQRNKKEKHSKRGCPALAPVEARHPLGRCSLAARREIRLPKEFPTSTTSAPMCPKTWRKNLVKWTKLGRNIWKRLKSFGCSIPLDLQHPKTFLQRSSGRYPWKNQQPPQESVHGDLAHIETAGNSYLVSMSWRNAAGLLTVKVMAATIPWSPGPFNSRSSWKWKYLYILGHT